MSDSLFTNKDVYELFDAIADLMEILGEDRFRILAYRRASQALQSVEMPLYDVFQRDRLQKIDGLSKGMAEKVAELFLTGDIEYYSRLQERMPVGVRELLRVPHIGPRTAGRLYNELGIAGLTELQHALEQGQLRQIKGIGERTLAGIRDGIAAVSDREQRTLLLHAWESGLCLQHEIADLSQVARVSWAGSLRRGQTTIGDLDLVVMSDQPDTVLRQLATLKLWMRAHVNNQQLSAVLPNGMSLDLIVVEPHAWGAALLLSTGSQQHITWMHQRAAQRDYQLSLDGVRHAGRSVSLVDEHEIYTALELAWIPPEVREWYQSDADIAVPLPHQLIDHRDMQGDLHMHTTWSDGSADIRTMAESARSYGYRHIAITDHGALIGVTNGLDVKRLRQQRVEIDAVNAEYAAAGIDFHILTGVEVDILVDGSLALPDAVLHELDIVVASPHIHLRQTPEVATQRIIRAMQHPAVDIIGHPRGRILGGRLGAPVDMDAVINEAVQHGVALEVNSGPDRLDIDGDLVREVMNRGGVISINSDAHAPANHAWIHQGVATARRGGATSSLVINTWSLAQLRAFRGRKRNLSTK
ncbi:MAG: DNA polymerase/3'-5' exonuclease PolX [Chloroflexi bacterium]|nr:DNA polymerase/3'-5' exonuclease PolX [Chloroflexota bacterium]